MDKGAETADAGEADASVLRLEVNLHPESGLYTAHLRGRHPMIVKAYRLAEVLMPIWDTLSDEGYFHRWPSDIVVDLHHRLVREANIRLAAEKTRFSAALSRIGDPDHPAGSAATLAEAREIAEVAFREAFRAGHDCLVAARNGAFAQTEAATDRDLLMALRRAALDALELFRMEGDAAPVTSEGLRGVLHRLQVAAELAGPP